MYKLETMFKKIKGPWRNKMKTVADATKMMRRMNFALSPRNVAEKFDGSPKVNVENEIAVYDGSSSSGENEADRTEHRGRRCLSND